jgi:hypothetical protein
MLMQKTAAEISRLFLFLFSHDFGLCNVFGVPQEKILVGCYGHKYDWLAEIVGLKLHYARVAWKVASPTTLFDIKKDPSCLRSSLDITVADRLRPLIRMSSLRGGCVAAC